MIDIEAVLGSAHAQLNSAYAKYKEPSGEIALEFNEMRLQACIFQYDVSAEMANIIRNDPSGFARSVALKGLVHRLFEYNETLNNHVIPKLLRLMAVRSIPVDQRDIKAERKKWGVEFHKLKAWSGARNNATGHYDPNMAKQVQALQSIDPAEVMAVCAAFISFNMAILRILLEAGRGDAA